MVIYFEVVKGIEKNINKGDIRVRLLDIKNEKIFINAMMIFLAVSYGFMTVKVGYLVLEGYDFYTNIEVSGTCVVGLIFGKVINPW